VSDAGGLIAPSCADIDALARAALDRLPAPFRARCPDMILVVEDLADDATLDDLGVDDPFELTGLYDGAGFAEPADAPSGAPDRVVLYRRAILDEWADRGNVTLAEMVAHVLVHEIGHHFGLSDEDIAAIDDWTA
jgi:predicted Zn-dependent protease with MMP-like domain